MQRFHEISKLLRLGRINGCEDVEFKSWLSGPRLKRRWPRWRDSERMLEIWGDEMKLESYCSMTSRLNNWLQGILESVLCIMSLYGYMSGQRDGVTWLGGGEGGREMGL
jgi:hypothetical protein